jgi:hypothetical protein
MTGINQAKPVVAGKPDAQDRAFNTACISIPAWNRPAAAMPGAVVKEKDQCFGIGRSVIGYCDAHS